MKRYIVNFTIERRVRCGKRAPRRLERQNYAGLEVVAADRAALTAQVRSVVEQDHPGFKLAGYSILRETVENS